MIAMDGNQVFDSYWLDPIEAAKRFISKPKFAGKLYTKFKMQMSAKYPHLLVFGLANPGLVFQTVQQVEGSLLLSFGTSCIQAATTI